MDSFLSILITPKCTGGSSNIFIGISPLPYLTSRSFLSLLFSLCLHYTRDMDICLFAESTKYLKKLCLSCQLTFLLDCDKIILLSVQKQSAHNLRGLLFTYPQLFGLKYNKTKRRLNIWQKDKANVQLF